MNLLKLSSFSRMRGFSLLEMAMVLAIIGLVMGTILSMTKTLTTSSKIAATQSKEALIKAALINFIATNNRLPCPADPTPAQLTGANAGTEAITAGVCNVAPNGLVVTGIVPWVSLGLTQDAATDGYNQLFTYQVTLTATTTVAVNAVTVTGQRTISGLRGDISIFSSTPINPATSLSSLGNQINYCTPVSYVGAVNPCAAVAIIVSHGADLYGAFTNGGQILPNTADELENANKDSNFVMHDFSMNSLNPFDDIVLPLSANDLLSQLTTNGSVQNYNTLLNTDIANITAAIVNYAMSHRSGVSGSITFSLPTALTSLSLPQSVTNDPWGSTFAFTNPNSITAITPASTVMATSTILFTLQSNGPDKNLGTADDLPASAVPFTLNQFETAVPSTFW